MDKEEPYEFIEDKAEDFINFNIQHDDSTKGSVKIDVNQDGTYDITVMKGPKMEVNKIRGVNKGKMIELLKSRL